MIKHLVLCLSVIPLLAMTVPSQTNRNYERFQAEFDVTGKTVGLTLPGSPGSVGCTNPNYKKGVITAVRYADSYKNDGNHVSGITVRYPNGKVESFDEEGTFLFSIWELPARERQPLESLFTRDRPVTVGVYYCGTAGYKRLYSVKDNSKQSSFLPRGAASSGQKLLSARGHFCGQSESVIVYIHLKVGNSIKIFSTSPDGGEKKKGFSGPYFRLPIGTELIIKYKRTSDGNRIHEAIATGRRNRSVRSCVTN